MQTNLAICVEATDYDTVGSILHLKGKNVEANAYVKIGAYHTLDLAIGRKFTIYKSEWDSVDIDRLNLAINVIPFIQYCLIYIPLRI